MSVIIIADSRGDGIQKHLEKIKPETLKVRVLTHRGAGSELAVLKSLSYIKNYSPNLVIITTGICDLTWRHKATRVTALRYDSVKENVSHVIEAAGSAVDLLKTAGSFRITLATITGIDLADYNNPQRNKMNSEQYKEYCLDTKVIHPQQCVLNESVLEVNRQITAINQSNKIPTVWMGGVVHTHSKKKTYHYYIRLADGCHADELTKEDWAKQISRAMVRIMPTDVQKELIAHP